MTAQLISSHEPAPVRAAVISAGAWSMHSHIPTLLAEPGVELVGVSTLSDDIAAQLRDRWPDLCVLDDWQELLSSAPDVVVVSSPPVAHLDQVRAALASGSTVLVEKPFAVSLDDAQQMAAVAEDLRGNLLVAFSWSSCPLFRAARALVPLVGEIDHVDAHLAVNTREVLLGANRGGWGGARIGSTDTYTSAAVSGGGAGMLSTSHLVAIVDWLTGLRAARLVALRQPDAPIELNLSILARTSTNATLALNTTSSQVTRGAPEWRVTIHGADADLTIDTRRELVELTPGPRSQAEPQTVNASGKVDVSFPTRMAVAVARGESPPPGLGHALGLHTVAVTTAAYRSCEAGGWVDVPTP